MSTGEVRHIEVRRTARYHLLGPCGSGDGGEDETEPQEVWFVLHGYRQLAGRFLRRFRSLDDGTRLIVAPEALSRFYVEKEVKRHGPESLVGASWMTRWDREAEIDDYVAYLNRLADRIFAEVGREGVRTTLLGFSQGVTTAARWAVLGRWPPDRLVTWGDTLPPDLPDDPAARRLAGIPVELVRGRRDPSRREEAEEDEEERLSRWDVPYRVHRHDGGHEIDPPTLKRICSTST